MGVNYGENAKCLGFDLLFILLWVAVWSITDIIVNHYMKSKVRQLWFYAALLAIMLITLIFINRGCGGTVSE
jgi:hypothetical protein